MKLQVEKRTLTGKKVKKLVKQNIIPAIVYGKHLKKPYNVQFAKNDFLRLYKHVGHTGSITLSGKWISETVLIHNLQTDPVTDNLIHVDFLAVKADEAVKAEVPLVIVGKEQLEKKGLGVNIIKDFIIVEALPANIPHDIKVDVSLLEKDEDNIMIKELDLPEKIKLLEEPEQAVVVAYDLSKQSEETEEKEWIEENPEEWEEKAN